MCGLSAAATKCKLFADQEEREIQRLAATIINHQVRRKTKDQHAAICMSVLMGLFPSCFAAFVTFLVVPVLAHLLQESRWKP
jgi:hypothetical protein